MTAASPDAPSGGKLSDAGRGTSPQDPRPRSRRVRDERPVDHHQHDHLDHAVLDEGEDARRHSGPRRIEVEVRRSTGRRSARAVRPRNSTYSHRGAACEPGRLAGSAAPATAAASRRTEGPISVQTEQRATASVPGLSRRSQASAVGRGEEHTRPRQALRRRVRLAREAGDATLHHRHRRPGWVRPRGRRTTRRPGSSCTSGSRSITSASGTFSGSWTWGRSRVGTRSSRPVAVRVRFRAVLRLVHRLADALAESSISPSCGLGRLGRRMECAPGASPASRRSCRAVREPARASRRRRPWPCRRPSSPRPSSPGRAPRRCVRRRSTMVPAGRPAKPGDEGEREDHQADRHHRLEHCGGTASSSSSC